MQQGKSRRGAGQTPRFISSVFQSPDHHHLSYFVILVPAIGGLMIGLIARYGSEKIRGHGIPEALEAILFGTAVAWSRKSPC